MSPGIQHEQEEEQIPESQPLLEVLRHSAHLKCILLSNLIVASVGAIVWCRSAQLPMKILNSDSFTSSKLKPSSACEDRVLFLPIGALFMLYFFYLVECYHCSIRAQMNGAESSSKIPGLVEALRSSQPIIWWKAIGYHYVRRTRHITRYRRGDAYSTDQFFYERVNSHSGGCRFNYTNCGVKDISKKLSGLSKHALIKIRFSKGFAFVNLEAANEFEEQRGRFFQESERRDDYLEMREGLDLTNVTFREFLVTFTDSPPRPWYTRQWVFWAASLLLLSWPIRFVIEYNTVYLHYQVTKLFGINYITPRSEDHYSRESVANQSCDLECKIANNCCLVPSYSEAMLIEEASTETLAIASMADPLNRDQSTNEQQNISNSSMLNIARRSSNINHQYAMPQGSQRTTTTSDGTIFYHATPLLRTIPNDVFHGRELTSPTDDPPKYEDVLWSSVSPHDTLNIVAESSVESVNLRRSYTERNLRAVQKFFLPRRSCHIDGAVRL